MKHLIIQMAKQLASELGLDEKQASYLQYSLGKQLPEAFAKNRQYLTHLLHQQEPKNDALAEQSLIGRLLLLPNIVMPQCLGMTPEFFYKQEYAEIFDTIRLLQQKNKNVDVDMVATALGAEKLNSWGGKYWLESLTLGHKDMSVTQGMIDRVVNAYKIRKAWEVSNQFIEQTYRTDIDDADQIIAMFKQSLDIAEDTKDSMMDGQSLADLAEHGLQENRERVAQGNKYPGYLHPIMEVNDILGGREKGNYYVEAGRPGMGKTAAALQEFSFSVLEQGEIAPFFSLEMTTLQLLVRMFCQRYKVTRTEWNEGLAEKRHDEDFKLFCKELASSGAHIDDTPAMTIEHIRSKCLKIKNKHGVIHRVFVDYLQLMESAEGSNREQKLSHISRGLKQLAKELNCPVIVLAQCSREVEKTASKRPSLSHLRESGSIEQDADCVCFWLRPEYYDILEDEEGNSLKGVAIYIVAKNRHGALDDIKMFFDADYTRMANIDERPAGYESQTHKNQSKEQEDSFWNSYNDMNQESFLPDFTN